MNAVRQSHGLTLIEVLIATAFLSLGLVMMLTAISRCLAVLNISGQYHKAMWALSIGESTYPLVCLPGMTPDNFEVPREEFDGVLYERVVDDPDKDAAGNRQRLIVVTTHLVWEGRGREQRESVPRYVLFKEE